MIASPWTPGVLAAEIKDKMPGALYVSHSTYPENHVIRYKQNSFRNTAVYADPDFLKILDYKLIKGNTDKVLLSPNSVILTASMAKRLFGDEDPIHQTVRLEDQGMLRVEAVIADVPKNSSIQFDYLLSWALYEKQNSWVKEYGMRDANFCLTMVQLRDQSFVNTLNGLLKNVYSKKAKTDHAEAFIYPIERRHLYSKIENGIPVGGKIEQVRIFLLLAFSILIIACVNFMNLSTARSEKRAKEVGIRKAIGSSRRSIMGQFMMESMLLAFLGTVVAFMLMEFSLPYFNGLLDTGLAINYQDWWFWAAILVLSLSTGILAGLYPAFYLSSFEPVKVLKGLQFSPGGTLSFRKILVVFQFVFASCLIVCTAVIYQQLHFIKNRPVGYDKNNLIEILADGSFKNPLRQQLFKEELLKSGAVTTISNFSIGLSGSGSASNGIEWPGKNTKEDITFNVRSAGNGFVNTIGTEMLSGREFSAQHADSGKVIINETAVKVMGLQHPIGKVITWADEPITIIGVMKDFVMESPYEPVMPMVVNNDVAEANLIVARLNPSQTISTSIHQIEEVFARLNPSFPMDLKYVDDAFNEQLKNERLLGIIANWFGGFAIFISCLGLLGLALYMAEQRKKEISIRKVLGASSIGIVRLLNRDFVALVAIANFIAFPIAYIIIDHWLSTFKMRIAISILPFAIAFILSLAIAVITVTLQSLKVATSNPADALKYE